MAKVFQCGWMNHDGNIGALEVFTRFFRVGWPKLFINIPYERRILGWIYLFFTHEHKKKYPSHNFFYFAFPAHCHTIAYGGKLISNKDISIET